MTPEQRLAQLVAALEQAGLQCLVMGGHAVRYYGVERNTVDFDFVVQVASAPELRSRLGRSKLLSTAREGPSWRPHDFARFEIGKLPDGREEWLEFWLRNHLLADFLELLSRHEKGLYGGTLIPFVSLGDLLRSKETERESDWQDISLLEEVQDARNLAAAATVATTERFLAQLRSQRGFERAVTMKLFDDADVVRAAIAKCEHPVSFAFLAPIAKDVSPPLSLKMPIDSSYLKPLHSSTFASPKHLGVIEAIRRAYKRRAIEIDRRDKQARLP